MKCTYLKNIIFTDRNQIFINLTQTEIVFMTVDFLCLFMLFVYSNNFYVVDCDVVGEEDIREIMKFITTAKTS